MTVEELIKYLETLPKEVEVLTFSSHYYGDATVIGLHPDFLDYTDYTTNEFVKEGHPAYGKKELIIGDS